MSETEKKPSVYDMIGGEQGVRNLVSRFYEIMDTVPEAYGVRKLHGADLSGSEEKLFMYLTGYLGGPQLYMEKHGHPRLRARHLPFAIASAPLRAALFKAFSDLADHMRNRAD